MSTQAQGQDSSQAQAQVHPIHQETATINELTRIVSEMPENDPHEGTDLELRKEPVEAKEQKEEVKEEKQEAGESIELDEDAPLFDVELKTETGKEAKKLSLKEMRDGYLRQQDYSRNIQKVKAQEAELSTRAQQAEQQAIQGYIEKINLHQQAVQKLAGVKSMSEIEAMSREDPAAAQQEFLRLISVNQTMQGLEAEKQAAMHKHQQTMHANRAKAIEHARQTLESDIPGWNADLYNKVLGEVVKDYGFRKEEVEQVIDPRSVKLFHDAYQFRQLQKAKPEISKKVVAVPKVVKPGSGEKANTSTTADEAAARLQKTGRGEDFVAWYAAQQKQQKRK